MRDETLLMSLSQLHLQLCLHLTDQSAYRTGAEGLITLSFILLPHAHRMERQEGLITLYSTYSSTSTVPSNSSRPRFVPSGILRGLEYQFLCTLCRCYYIGITCSIANSYSCSFWPDTPFQSIPLVVGRTRFFTCSFRSYHTSCSVRRCY